MELRAKIGSGRSAAFPNYSPSEPIDRVKLAKVFEAHLESAKKASPQASKQDQENLKWRSQVGVFAQSRDQNRLFSFSFVFVTRCLFSFP